MKLKEQTKRIWYFAFKHAIFTGIAGTTLFLIMYYYILKARNELVGGYYSSPFLTTLSELNWFLIGMFLYLLGLGITKLVQHKRKRKKK